MTDQQPLIILYSVKPDEHEHHKISPYRTSDINAKVEGKALTFHTWDNDGPKPTYLNCKMEKL